MWAASAHEKANGTQVESIGNSGGSPLEDPGFGRIIEHHGFTMVEIIVSLCRRCVMSHRKSQRRRMKTLQHL
jgi:hypothetical protein